MQASAPLLNITLDCTQCKQRKLQLVTIFDLGQYQPVGKIRGKFVYTGLCKVCEIKARSSH